MTRGNQSVRDALADRKLSVLVIHDELPTYDRQSGGLRLHRYVEAMLAEGHDVTFLARAAFGQERYAEDLRAAGVEVHLVDYRRLRAAGHRVAGLGVDLSLLLKRKRFDLVYLNFYHTSEQYLPDIRRFSPATRIIIDTHDVHHVRERRGAELADDPAALKAAERTRAREAAIYSQADLLGAVSVDDARALEELAPGVPVEIVTNVHVDVPPGPPFEERSGLVFVANFDHTPNVDAILDFHAHSWPLIAEALPDAQLMIVGFSPPPAVKALGGGRIAVTGQVPETGPYLDAARVSIAPLRYGAGVKGKIGEALMHGLPVVTTPIGAEGMDLKDGEHVLIAEAGEEFARAVIGLYEDAETWRRIATTGRTHIRERHSFGAAVDSLRRAFDRAVPRQFVARVSPWSGDAAARLVRDYVERYDEHDHVSLLVPVTPDDPQPDAVCAMLAEAIEAAGQDPEHVPDIAVTPCAEHPPVPSCATLLGVADDRERPDSEPEPHVSIIIPAYGKRAMTDRCLAALERTLGERIGDDVELVLVDNHSPDDTRRLFRRWSDRATVIELPENRNFAGGINAGARSARGRVLMVISTDMEIGPGAVDAMVREVEQPGVGLVGARMCYPDGRIQHAGIGWVRNPHGGVVPYHRFHHEPGDHPQTNATVELDAVTGGCIAVRADLFELVGGFDERYVNGWEDSDLCLAIRSTGASVRLVADAEIVHHEGVTSGGSYHGHANPERFYARWAQMVTDDSPNVQSSFGGCEQPIISRPTPRDDPDGAPLRVVGPVIALGPRAAEARGVLRALELAGEDVAARTIAPTWIGPILDEEHWRSLYEFHFRPARPDAMTVSFADEAQAADASIVRVGGPVASRPPEAIAWVAAPAVRDRLREQGWPDHAIELLAPAAIDSPLGEGGAGVLVWLPTHERSLTTALLAGLRDLAPWPVRVIPSVRTPDLQRTLREALPAAELFPAVANERLLAAVAGKSDLVIALDPSDEFDRIALTAAAAGAAVLVRPGGPAAWVLGDLAMTVDPASPELVLGALGRDGFDASAAARAERSETVSDACGPDATVAALRRLLSALRTASR
jgi:GT2 family glycosyltransferase/glycosyltransferase involved in cell wall biosynthesis